MSRFSRVAVRNLLLLASKVPRIALLRDSSGALRIAH